MPTTRGLGRSFRKWLAIALIVAGLDACDAGKQGEKTPVPGEPLTPTSEAAISGTITLDPALQDKVGNAPLLMIFASTSSDPSRPALVVKREPNASFPYRYKLTPEDITLVGSSFAGKLHITARIDPAGMVGPPRPGTFGGTYSGNPVQVGSSNIDIAINKTY